MCEHGGKNGRKHGARTGENDGKHGVKHGGKNGERGSEHHHRAEHVVGNGQFDIHNIFENILHFAFQIRLRVVHPKNGWTLPGWLV